MSVQSPGGAAAPTPGVLGTQRWKRLLPIVFGSGTGSEVMSRIAAPMLGGMITAPLLSMFVIPAAYKLMRRQPLRTQAGAAEPVPARPPRVAARG